MGIKKYYLAESARQAGRILEAALMALTDPDARWEVSYRGSIRDYYRHGYGACPLTWQSGAACGEVWAVATARFSSCNCVTCTCAFRDALTTIIAAVDEPFHLDAGRIRLRRLFLRLVEGNKTGYSYAS
jgi:hypothetical protein